MDKNTVTGTWEAVKSINADGSEKVNKCRSMLRFVLNADGTGLIKILFIRTRVHWECTEDGVRVTVDKSGKTINLTAAENALLMHNEDGSKCCMEKA